MSNDKEGLMFQVDVDSETDSDNDNDDDVIPVEESESEEEGKKNDNDGNGDDVEEKKIIRMWNQGLISTHQKARMILECREKRWTAIMEEKNKQTENPNDVKTIAFQQQPDDDNK